jgi:tetratricopeptide (TPR) repeat protein
MQNALAEAMRHHGAGRLREAEALYRQVLAVEPTHAIALHHLGIVAHQTGRQEMGIELLRQTIKQRPDWPEAHSNLGNLLRGNGQFDEAITVCRRAIALKPDFAEAFNNLGFALQGKGQIDEAIGVLQRAIALNPNLAEAHNNLGNALKEKKQIREAVSCFRQGIALHPKSAEAHNNLGAVLSELGETLAAIAEFREAIALRPNYAIALNNLGCALKDLGQDEQAIAVFRQAIGHSSALAEGHSNLAGALGNLGRNEEAIAASREAIAQSPTLAAAHMSMGIALLSSGDFEQGWNEYEWRCRHEGFRVPERAHGQPVWDGSPLEGRSLLIYTEQGLGDSIQFVRYLPLLIQQGSKVVIECQAEVERLVRLTGWDCQIVKRGEPLPHFDLHCPLLSLPRAFGTTLSNLPSEVPYLKADAEDAKMWQHRLAERDRLKVGLVWAGSAGHKNDRNRSMGLSQLGALRHVPGVRFFSLQKGELGVQYETEGAPLELINWTAELGDLADTAALISNLDLVIAVDTGVAHLAGALSKPVWVLLPAVADWRWLREGEDSPWYPTMRLFRQKSAGDWAGVVDRVAETLAEFGQERVRNR